MDVSFSQALNAYKSAQKIADTAARTGVLPQAAPTNPQPDFWQMVDKNLNQAVNTQYRGEAAGVASLSNKVSPTDLAVAVNNAEMTLRTITAIRDRVITAYQDIIKMPI